MMNNRKERYSNIEALRIFSILGVTILFEGENFYEWYRGK